MLKFLVDVLFRVVPLLLPPEDLVVVKGAYNLVAVTVTVTVRVWVRLKLRALGEGG
jgi:hypothetical protein